MQERQRKCLQVEAETRVMLPPAKERQETQKLEEAGQDCPQEPLEEVWQGWCLDVRLLASEL